jgi:glycine cleavage system pyridoxal-binding protein P
MLSAIGAVARRADRPDDSARHSQSTPLDLPEGEAEHEYLRRLRGIAARNTVARSYIGLGYYDCVTPSVVLRNMFENPGWYTPYTPYQAEIAQGRLESLLNFQTVVRDLTAMDIATASLLDEGTAAAEAMAMFHRLQAKTAAPGQESVFLASDRCYPQTLEVVRGRAEPLGIRVEVGDAASFTTATLSRAFGLLLQCPDERGAVSDLRGIIERAHGAGPLVVVATDLLALTLMTPPGEMGADACVGNSQRLGVPLGYVGPTLHFWQLGSLLCGRHWPHHRLVDRRAGPPGVSHGAADARAAHPPRKGDLEHLHGAGIARQHRGDVRRTTGRVVYARSRPAFRASRRRSATR